MADSAVVESNHTEEVAQELYTVVCRNGGRIDVVEAVTLLSDKATQYVNTHGYYPLLESSFKDLLFLHVLKPLCFAILYAKTNVDFCESYNRNSVCAAGNSCVHLHVCRRWLRDGECACNLNHDFQQQHEQQVLSARKLHQLDAEALVAYLRPIVVNRAEHPVVRHIAGEMTKLVLLKTVQDILQPLCSREETITAPTDQSNTVDEICGFHLRGTCRYGNSCPRYKHNLPYLWQIKLSIDNQQKWISIVDESNKLLEKDFCDVTKDKSDLELKIEGLVYSVRFLEMLAKNGQDGSSTSYEIRRLSTVSRVKALPGDNNATFWAWFWRTDYNTWEPYVQMADDRNDSLSNDKLEEIFLSGTCTRIFTLNNHTYLIDFKNMLQCNQATGKKREIRRRPQNYITSEHLQTMMSRPRNRRFPNQQSPVARIPPGFGEVIFPRNWSAMTEDVDFLMVELEPASQEYRDTEKEFKKTLGTRTIVKIERIQNPELWEQYIRKLGKIAKKHSGTVEERQLFHGTNESAVNAICQQGFDWRLCGANGTLYGKGNYFARDASYSNSYATQNAQGERKMFLVKCIVGSYALGNPNTVRPPPIDPSKPHELHNSCVDNMNKPSIFVVYDNDQSYPLTLITYK